MPAPKIDVNSLQRKYEKERAKRLATGNRHYRDPLAVFPALKNDPWVKEPLVRDPVVEDRDVVIAGTGIAGILAAIRLNRAGVTNFRMIDLAGDFGGVWYWNRYPGIRCDIESYIYLPLIEEVGTIPSDRYATGEEIREHCMALASQNGLYDRTLFQTKIEAAEWDRSRGRWIVTTTRGDRISARFFIGSSGFQHFPKVPDIEGLENFKGTIFHPSRWDFQFSGGSPRGDLDGLRGKKVALVGTGATSIQILPHLAKHAEAVYLVQRTPAAVSPRHNHRTDVDWFRSQLPGWQLRRQDNFYDITSGNVFEEDLLDDCWTRETRKLALATAGKTAQEAGLAYQMADYELMEELRGRIDQIVTDPALREALKPWYNLYCKRPLFADDYLECFNHANVHLVDTDGKGIEQIVENGFVANGKEYAVDGIILASGFEIGTYNGKSSTFPIRGSMGTSLAEKLERGISSVHGLQFAGFPNFMLVGTAAHSISSFNYTWSADKQAQHAAEFISTVFAEDIKSVDVTIEAEANWSAEVEALVVSRDFFENCTPGYFNNEGDASSRGIYTTTYAGGATKYLSILAAWREGDFRADCIVEKMPAS